MQYLGIDISKDKFDVALIVDESEPEKSKQKVFINDKAGFAKLMLWLGRRATEPVHVAMEATNVYWEALASFLHEQGLKVSVVNPKLIKKEAESWGVRNKTDKVDATVIARYALAKHPRAWSAPDPELRELRDLTRHLAALEGEKQQHLNRLESGVASSVVRESMEKTIAFLDTEIKRLTKQIRDHIDKHPGLKNDVELLESIPGIGVKIASVILAELQDYSNFSSAKEVAAYAGVSPKKHSSGKFIGQTKMCKIGNSRLRRALYLPAVVARTYNPVISEMFLRLIRNGKCKMAAIGACMRKLLCIAYGVLKSGRPFEVPA